MSVSLHLWPSVGFVVIINNIVATLHDVTMLAEQVAMYRLLTHSGRISIVRYVEPRLLWQSPMEPHTFLAPYLSHGGGRFLDALLEATGTQSVFVRLARLEAAGDAFTTFIHLLHPCPHSLSGALIDSVPLASRVSVASGVPLRLLLLLSALFQSVLASDAV